MRVISQLHPALQVKVVQLVNACKAQGINITIGECVRTVAEQDALYAKGRTKPGSKVTNCKGSSYSSMHQWLVAFDFFLNMDIDGDGKTSDDIYNNNTKMFNKVGAIGKSLGLEWGGDWKSPVDLPHFQLPDWGSTASKLKKIYGTPDKFKKSWTGTNVTVPTTNVPVAGKHYVDCSNPATVINRLQKALGVPVGSSMEDTLAKTITLRKGCSGTVVALLQEYWTGLGLYSGEIDGLWGKQSDAAAYYCQLKVVGIDKPDMIYSARGKSWKKSLGLI